MKKGGRQQAPARRFYLTLGVIAFELLSGRLPRAFDGLSLAWAVAEYLATNAAARPKTLFATHYHELTQLASSLPRLRDFGRIVAMNVTVALASALGVEVPNATRPRISMDEHSVTFRYKDYRDKNRQKLMTLDAMEFIRRFLMHVLHKSREHRHGISVLSQVIERGEC